MAYGKIKADTLVYDNSGSDVEVTLSSLGNKANLASPTFTGTVTIPTPAANDNTTKAASTAYVQTELGDYATTASPTFTGTPAAPTAAANTNTTQIATTAYVQTELGDYATLAAPALTGTATGVNLTLSGNLTVNGTTTTINSTTLAVDDKNIVLGDVSSPSDTTADGGGITLKGASDKTFNWVDATNAWTTSEHIHFGDNEHGLFGTGSDLKVYANGSHSYIQHNGDGDLWLQAQGADENIWFQAKDDVYIQTNDNENAAKFIKTGAVELYHNNSKKFETTTAGVTVTGTVSDSKGDLRTIVMGTITSHHTCTAADAGKSFASTAGVTFPNSVFTAGQAITVINNSGSDITLTQGSGVSLYNTADAATGNRTLASRGMATVLYISASVAYISGAGLS